MLRIAIAVAALLMAAPALATEAGWALLREGGHVVFLNHANATGTHDSASFDIENCRTQRNLSDRGRNQARRIGALFAARAAPVDQVYSSRYCRARDTAEIAFGASRVETIEALDLLTGEEDEETLAARVEAIMEIVRGYTGSGNLVMVTHDANVQAWAGVRPREGEAVIVAPEGDGLRSAARIVFN